MNISELNKNDNILCVTAEESRKLELLLHSLGLTWRSGYSYKDESSSSDYLGYHHYFPKKGTHSSYNSNDDGITYPLSMFLDIEPTYDVY